MRGPAAQCSVQLIACPASGHSAHFLRRGRRSGGKTRRPPGVRRGCPRRAHARPLRRDLHLSRGRDRGGGGKACAWGCLGVGDCAAVCVRRHHHECLRPARGGRRLHRLRRLRRGLSQGSVLATTVSHKLWVACKSHADGDTAEAQCEVACTACGKCVADASPRLMRLDVLANANFKSLNYPNLKTSFSLGGSK